MIESFAHEPFLEGFALCLSLILALGPQNTYVIRQGALGKHVFTVIVVCSLCDMTLICMGAFGLAHYIGSISGLREVLIWGGVIFIGSYAIKSWRRAIMGGYLEALETGGSDVASRSKVILSAMGFSILNPHAILDTVILIGGMAVRYEFLDDKIAFAVGASLASIVWFIALGYCARAMSKIFRNPIGVRVFDGIVGTIMLWLLWNLFSSVWPSPPV